jgi:DNA-dependent RNA polymerase auxiliary subunit epsilon
MQLLAAGAPLARASLVTMSRLCGKKTCRCARGEKHVSLYLATRIGKTRKMLYVAPELENAARRLVENAKKALELIEEMSQASLERFVQEKTGRERRPRS